MAKKWLACCGIGCGATIVLGVAMVTIAYKTSGFGRSVSNVEKMMAKAKAAGLPLESADLVKHRDDDPKLNLASYCGEYMSLIGRNSDLEAKNDQYRKQLKREQDALTIFANLKEIEELAKIATKASKSSYFEGVTDWDKYALDIDYVDHPYAGAKGMVAILSGRARAEMLTGQSGAAFADFYRAAKIARLVGTEPSMIAQLVRNSCESIAIRSLEYTLPKQANNAALLAQSRAFLDSFGPLGEPVANGKAEFMLGLSGCRNMRSYADAQAMASGKMASRPAFKRLQRQGVPATFLGRAFASGFIECWLELLELCKKPMSDRERMKAYKDFDKKVQGKGGFEYFIAQLSFGIFGSVQEAIVRHNAQMACLKALVQVLQYRVKHHRLPNNLAEAGVKEIDPYTEKPLKLVSDAYSVSVYSLGPDLADDRGAVKSSSTGDSYDIVATCPLVK